MAHCYATLPLTRAIHRDFVTQASTPAPFLPQPVPPGAHSPSCSSTTALCRRSCGRSSSSDGCGSGARRLGKQAQQQAQAALPEGA